MNTRPVALGMGAAMLTLGAIFMFAADKDQEATFHKDHTSQATTSHQSKVKVLIPSECTFTEGHSAAYSWELSVDEQLDPSTQNKLISSTGSVQTQQAGVHKKALALKGTTQGRLELALVGEREGAYVLAASVSVTGHQGSKALNPIEKSPIVLIRVEKNCQVRDFGWRTDASEQAVLHTQTLLSDLSWALPRPDERTSTTLLHNSGIARASFERQGALIVGRLSGFERMHVPGEKTIAKSRVVVRPSATGWFEGLSSTSSMRASFGPSGKWKSSISIEARRVQGDTPQPPEIAALEDPGWRWGHLFGAVTFGGEPDIHNELVGDPLEDVMERFFEMLDGSSNPAERITMLIAWMRANPDQIPMLVELIKQNAFANPFGARAELFYALGSANTPATRAALMQIMNNEGMSNFHADAAQSMGRSYPVPPEFESWLVTQASSPGKAWRRGELTLTVGLVARTQRAHNPELSARLTDVIEGWFEQPPIDMSTTDLIAAANNTGDGRFIDHLVPLTHSDDPRTSQLAVNALGQMPYEQVVPEIRKLYTSKDATSAQRTGLLAGLLMREEFPGADAELVQATSSGLSTQTNESELLITLKYLSQAAAAGDAGAQRAIDDLFVQELTRKPPRFEVIKILGQLASKESASK